MSEASEWAKEVTVWEAHRCPRCRRKWAREAPDGLSGRPLLLMCPLCWDEIRCNHKDEHPPACYCNFNPPPDERA